MNWLRRALIEFWAMVALSALIGFLGPFGTYLNAEFPSRSWHWWIQLMGAYVLVRPSILMWAAMAEVASIPPKVLVFWGVFLSSFPLALLWAWSADAFFHGLNGFAGILPFAMLSALGVLGVTVWARWADERLRSELMSKESNVSTTLVQSGETESDVPFANEAWRDRSEESEPRPDHSRLARRLSRDFQGPVIALQSEDHYVRVHGRTGSQLILMRLRDAIDEMDGVLGAQVHRSWWVAEGGIASTDVDGRKFTVRLLNGAVAPVARASISRLQRTGFIHTKQQEREQ